jgi:hypothetical protein
VSASLEERVERLEKMLAASLEREAQTARQLKAALKALRSCMDAIAELNA